MTPPTVRRDTADTGAAVTPLTRRTADRIADHIGSSGLSKGIRLVERFLAQLLKVSRSPVRQALRLLEQEGVVESAERGGYWWPSPAPTSPRVPFAARHRTTLRTPTCG
ncbi:winged helix-turn-helix domain-containing protein [Streptomyces sp. CRN 30]|uniref:winged helix-turn-helix domain-containing protein n=1 Tax=Streptomyces sp. CRN 30 TaxID=3075613 RepID=UPI002A81B620|nr:winged helix-turn-helix domain-containing protein [Streptomyces sp. CRN 30]